jgi:hypothetical protein
MAIKNERPTSPDGLAPPIPDENTSRETRPPPLDAVPWLMLSHAEVLMLALDHREGFLLSLIDGRTNVETLLELAAMPKREVLRVLARWMAMGVVTLRDEDPPSSVRGRRI